MKETKRLTPEHPGVRRFAIVFVDVAGSTRLYETAGDEMAKGLIIAIEDRIAGVVARMGGEVQEIVGDEVMFRFQDVDGAVSCAIAIQEAVETFSTQRGLRVSVRIGIHFGTAIVEEGRMFGDTINTAARIAGIAQGGQVVVSEDVVKRLGSPFSKMSRRFDVVKVKGKQEKIVVYDLPWRMTNLTMIQPAVPSPSSTDDAPRMRLRFQATSHCLSAVDREFSIGRSPANDLVVTSGSVSRSHATIDFGRERFVYNDKSTNGTYLQTQDGETVYLRRESIPLWGSGRIGLGAPLKEGAGHVVWFDCD